MDPSICHGRPCIRGHRIWVSLIVDLLADGMTTEQIIEQYPGLEPDDVRVCLAYAAEMTRERIVVTGRGALSPFTRSSFGCRSSLCGLHQRQPDRWCFGRRRLWCT